MASFHQAAAGKTFIQNFIYFTTTQVAIWRSFYGTIIALKPLVLWVTNIIQFSSYTGPQTVEDQTEQFLLQESVSMLDHERDSDHDGGSLPRGQQRCLRHCPQLWFYGGLKHIISLFTNHRVNCAFCDQLIERIHPVLHQRMHFISWYRIWI